MTDKKEQLVNLVMNGNVSAITILEDRLEIPSEQVVEIIKELLKEGRLRGSLTDDEKRFFKSEVKLSGAPAIDSGVKPPEFLSFNTRPPIIVSIIGFLIIAAGLIVNANATDVIEQNFAAVLLFVGLFITMAGLYWISQRKTPS